VGFDAYGAPVHGPPVELKPSTTPPSGVRWLTNRRNVMLPNGDTVAIDADVTLTTDVNEGDLLWLGTLSEWLGQGSSQVDTERVRVHKFEKTPDVKARFVYRSCMVIRFTTKD
jgi:hypothetical protein